MAWHGMARHKLSTSILWSICRDEFLKNNYFLLLNQRHIHEIYINIYIKFKKKKTVKDKNINSKNYLNSSTLMIVIKMYLLAILTFNWCK